ncbi:unnamed protein product [Periconia digitata]|uniref:Alkaline ceramidase 3 n=1 Tax=Periconia digitata TaxID=1303443 RepID=A0A9W4U2T3_9PLEO|nr:unnamed protein product [Periconia digitata]
MLLTHSIGWQQKVGFLMGASKSLGVYLVLYVASKNCVGKQVMTNAVTNVYIDMEGSGTTTSTNTHRHSLNRIAWLLSSYSTVTSVFDTIGSSCVESTHSLSTPVICADPDQASAHPGPFLCASIELSCANRVTMASGLLSHLPSVPYPPSQAGRWSPVTSTINWCEEDYYATVYSAEVVNTLTNLLFMYLAAKGIYSCVKDEHDKVFIVAYIGYLLTGTGSFFFHSTLKYPMQLIDELSMIYTTCLMNYATFSFSRTPRFRLALASGLTFLALFITLYYHYLQDPTFHQITYAILTIIVFFRAVWVMEVNMRPRFRRNRKSEDSSSLRSNSVRVGAEKAELEREDERDRAILRQMWTMIAWGLSIFLGGFLLWHLDREHCHTLRNWRRQIGMPWGFFLELHGWWHIMTGTGGYFYIVWCTWLRHCLNYRQDDYELIWPRWLSMPVVSRQCRSRGTDDHGMHKSKKQI